MFSNLIPFLDNPCLLTPHPSPLTSSQFFQSIQSYQLLVIGAGGLGCEIIKNLALSGIKTIHLIDMDTIDLTNLNRQFLFRQKDIGKYKADVVADKIMKICKNVKIIPYKNKIQEMNYQFFKQFGIIIGGLDNVEARKYLNDMVFRINMEKEQQNGGQQQQQGQLSNTQCYYIDGATQGFQGQALLVQPFKTSCYQCSILQGLSTQPKPNYCTIANTPRTPQHCIQYVLQILWQQHHGHLIRDNDNLQHMRWVYEKSLQRAKQYKIDGVTEMLTLGVVKNIIPAVVSTNALIAGVVTGEVFKLLTGCGPKLNNYFLYRGGVSIGSDTILNQKKQTCQACKMKENKHQNLKFTLKYKDNLETLLNQIKNTHENLCFSIINHKNKTLLNSLDSERYEKRLKMTFQEFIQQGRFNQNQEVQILYVTDNSLKSQLKIQLIIKKD